ncbi:hypothetical protein GF420_00285 [candidate division GN15 bacterium]|nr:hypothetical protein [candidate division GN15 bacterium]
MHKRVLVAESAEAIRSVAETVLRQHGFEVISLPTVDKAQEVLQFSVPDVLIIGADLVTGDGRPFYESLQSNPRTASIPMLLFDSVDSEGLPFPDEVIISRPFDPKDFIQRVQVFSGQAGDERKQEKSAQPFGDADLDDELLDHALGLDQIQVEESEVMDKTTVTGKVKQKAAQRDDKMVGLESYSDDSEEASDSQKVESLMIREGEEGAAGAPPRKQGTGPIEILNDQYGMTEPKNLQPTVEDQNHDYDWFINAMREEEGVEAPPSATPAETTTEELHVEHPAESVDPVTPATGAASAQQQTQTPSEKPPKTAGVEKFIDEFREEMERIRTADEPQVVTVKPDEAAAEGAPSGDELSWEEKLEQLTPAEAALFSRQFAKELAEKIAEKIVAKIDSEKLLKLIAAEIAERARQKQPQ